MTNLISNLAFDKAFPQEREDCEILKSKSLEKDIKRILAKEKIIDYRCYLKRSKQVIYYIAETKELYIAYKEDLITRKQVAYGIKKEEL